MRFRMIDTERSRSAGVILWPFGGTAFRTTSRPPWRSRPRWAFLCSRRAGHDRAAPRRPARPRSGRSGSGSSGGARTVGQLSGWACLGRSPASTACRLDVRSSSGRAARPRSRASRAGPRSPGASSTATSSSATRADGREEPAGGEHLVADAEVVDHRLAAACWRRRCGRTRTSQIEEQDEDDEDEEAAAHQLASSDRASSLLAASLRMKSCQSPGLDRRSRACGQVEQEAQVVQAEQPQPEQLLLVDEVADVGAREARAGRAAAALVERPRVAREAARSGG